MRCVFCLRLGCDGACAKAEPSGPFYVLFRRKDLAASRAAAQATVREHRTHVATEWKPVLRCEDFDRAMRVMLQLPLRNGRDYEVALVAQGALTTETYLQYEAALAEKRAEAKTPDQLNAEAVLSDNEPVWKRARRAAIAESAPAATPTASSSTLGQTETNDSGRSIATWVIILVVVSILASWVRLAG